jgi:hypothetical protein
MINISGRQAGRSAASIRARPSDATKWDDLVTKLGLTGLSGSGSGTPP